MTFTKGKEHYAPIQYQSFEVGPYDVTLQPREDETYREMLTRANGLLDELFEEEFERQLNLFMDRLERMGKIVQARRSR